MSITIIVEGKNDRSRLQQLLEPSIHIVCTYGTPSTSTLEKLSYRLKDDEVYILTDNDSSGKAIRSKLRECFPDATHIYTRRGYNGVEHTPLEYLLQQFEKAGLADYIVNESAKPASWSKEQF